MLKCGGLHFAGHGILGEPGLHKEVREAVECAMHAVRVHVKVEARMLGVREGVAVSGVPRQERIEVPLPRVFPVAQEEHVL